MVNVYAYTYPQAMRKYKNHVLVKIGDSVRDVDTRMDEQSGAAEYEDQIRFARWNGLKNIKRDFTIHRHLDLLGLRNEGGKGKEWFKIPAKNLEEAKDFIDSIITKLEGRVVRQSVQLRKIQSEKLEEALAAIETSGSRVDLIANLCPRFGKTIWALMLFNELTEKYGTNTMLLPAYWLSSHTSFSNELDLFEDFLDIDYVNNELEYKKTLQSGRRAIVPISLHQELEVWKSKYKWLTKIDMGKVFVFADEGDFGTHTKNQVEKLNFLYSRPIKNGKMVRVYASGTNVQRLAKIAPTVQHVLYTAYSELETTEPSIVKRKFYSTEISNLKSAVEKEQVAVQPSWLKIWGKPRANKKFIETLFESFVGDQPLLPNLNLSQVTDEEISCFMVLVSANNKEMGQIKTIVENVVPDFKVVVLNGDYTTNKDAEFEVRKNLNIAKNEGFYGVIIVANQMGSRSFSISEIQASVIAYDRGSVDASTQKVSRCVTPGKTFEGDEKAFGHIVELSFDPNRSENIEKLIVEEIISVQKSQDTDFVTATSFVLNCIDLSKINEFGYLERVDTDELFRVLGKNENLLRVADITADIGAIIENDLVGVLVDVIRNNDSSVKKEAINKAINKIKQDKEEEKEVNKKDPVVRKLEELINMAVKTINMSATSVYMFSLSGNNYRECLNNVPDPDLFADVFGIHPKNVNKLLDHGVLNEPILDVIVQNSKNVSGVFDA